MRVMKERKTAADQSRERERMGSEKREAVEERGDVEMEKKDTKRRMQRGTREGRNKDIGGQHDK